jgi:hypothetical protein
MLLSMPTTFRTAIMDGCHHSFNQTINHPIPVWITS